jgi:hypothetical protein
MKTFTSAIVLALLFASNADAVSIKNKLQIASVGESTVDATEGTTEVATGELLSGTFSPPLDGPSGSGSSVSASVETGPSGSGSSGSAAEKSLTGSGTESSAAESTFRKGRSSSHGPS